MLQRNHALTSYFLSRTDLENLLLPMLKLLYHVSEEKTHQTYMLLIIVLALSQDEAFNKCIHALNMTTVPWFTERVLTNISLGGLLVLVLVRTVQFNLSKMRDVYLHTNCLAALANMSSHFQNLHPYAAQRLLSLLDLLAKKYAKLVKQSQALSAKQAAASSSASAQAVQAQMSEIASDAVIYADFLRIVLEIINSTLTHCLQHNPHLIYTLLHKRDLFVPFRTNPRFQDLIVNIETVIAYFAGRLDTAAAEHGALSSDVVLDTIRGAAKQWSSNRLKQFPELKFRYQEEEQPSEFFIPYVWSLVFHRSALFHNDTGITLFPAAGGSAGGDASAS